MRKKAIYHYYVEGDDERSVLNTLKSELKCIESGKIDCFNVIQSKFTYARIRPLKPGTIIVLVFDTDITENIDILQYNIKFLQEQNIIKDVICIPQVENLEDELKRACCIKDAKEITKSETKKDYKRDLISCSNLGVRLRECGFNVSDFWSKVPSNQFARFGNDSQRIKIVNEK